MKRILNFSGKHTFIVLVYTVLFIFHVNVLSQAPIKILPLGNSITFDFNNQDVVNPRPDGVRISYRYKLFQLLRDAGHTFDYVGSENCGFDYFLDRELDDNAGFPGIETWQLTNLMDTGYNAITEVWVTLGPYLNFYPADIILLHIGTNNLVESASDVEDLLDKIRSFDNDVIILVAKIINRQTYHASTTTFNSNVESMVNSRGDNHIRMVNIETGANINYSNDMADNLHPNLTGYDKMAYKWFEAIDNLNQAPVLSFISEQISHQGKAFSELLLDDYVYDIEDTDDLLSWTFSQQPDSHLDVSIDANRILHVAPVEDWRGTEIVELRVEDTGSGAFRKSDSKEILFTINNPPVITSLPTVSELQVGVEYQYIMTATDTDELDSLTFYAINKPDWLSFKPEIDNAILSGTASVSDTGSHSIVLMVSDGHHQIFQEFSLEVIEPTRIWDNHILMNQIYPNPTNNEITIHTKRAGFYVIEIASSNGHMLYSGNHIGSAHRIDLSSFLNGVYIITIRSEDFVTTEKIFKL